MEEHPLQHSWTAWAHNRKAADYGAAMSKIATFNTVEGFWRFMNFTPCPSEMFSTDVTIQKFTNDIEGISLFKTGVKPEWEEPRNMTGGELQVRKTLPPAQLDQSWEELVMAAVGETLDPADSITGVRIVDKSAKGKVLYRLEIWFDVSQESDSQMVEAIRENLAHTLGNNFKFDYRDHNKAVSTGGGGHEAPQGGGGGHGGGGGRFYRGRNN